MLFTFYVHKCLKNKPVFISFPGRHGQTMTEAKTGIKRNTINKTVMLQYQLAGSISTSNNNSDTYGIYKFTGKERDKESDYDYFACPSFGGAPGIMTVTLAGGIVWTRWRKNIRDGVHIIIVLIVHSFLLILMEWKGVSWIILLMHLIA